MITGAHGIHTFTKAGGKDDVCFAKSIASSMLSKMRTPMGTFAYRRGRLHVKAVPYARWSNAPMCLAHARLVTACDESVS